MATVFELFGSKTERSGDIVLHHGVALTNTKNSCSEKAYSKQIVSEKPALPVWPRKSCIKACELFWTASEE
ncbi:hypothetical protein CCR75_007555 [Bremia lactucae]|uniref:Uncharacterized protein n=1 Tax=Bremia lactucae TaxID=4779 RepID=A0A976ILB0_BRELC|nr:hypothetical protein CCR75_007555 [Bremia lactucae]